MQKQQLWNFGSTTVRHGFRFELPDSSRIEYTRDYQLISANRGKAVKFADLTYMDDPKDTLCRKGRHLIGIWEQQVSVRQRPYYYLSIHLSFSSGLFRRIKYVYVHLHQKPHQPHATQIQVQFQALSLQENRYLGDKG